MLDLVSAFPEQCRQAAGIEVDVTSLRTGLNISSVVVLGMGGSAVGGDLLRVLLEAEGARVPVVVSRDYRCPGFVGPETLCIAVSYSGNTEETLAAARDALRRSARLLAVTTGGELTSLAQDHGLPIASIPAGQPPRSALGYLFFPALKALSMLGLCRDFSPDTEEAIANLEAAARNWGADAPETGNEARRIAHVLHRCLPVIYGSSPATGVVAFRWKCQFNENAKMHAIWNNLPELDHNEICGWRSARRQGKLRWVFVRDRLEAPRLARRVEVTRSILASEQPGVLDVWGTGDTLLSRLMTAMLLGDFVTTYAAHLNHTDPIDIQEIDTLKVELSRS
jgi:glucose/mannose-6-phosphate isomerase